MKREKKYTLAEIKEKLKLKLDEVNEIEKHMKERGTLVYPKYLEGHKDALKMFYSSLARAEKKDNVKLTP